MQAYTWSIAVMLRRWKEGRKKIVMLWYPYHTEKRGTEGICDPASVEGVPEEYHAPLLGTLHACAERITAETSLPALLNTLLLLPSHWPDNESAAAAAGSATGEAIWRALALLFTTGIVVHDGLQKPAASIAALAALAALATCDGSCARAGAAELQAAAVHAAQWGVFHPEDRQACAEALRAGFYGDAAPRPASHSGHSTAAGGCGSCRWRLLGHLVEHGLTPPEVLPAYSRRLKWGARLDGMFLAARGDKYDVSCVCVALERPSARYAFCAAGSEHTRELERRVGPYSMSAGGRDVCLSTRLPQRVKWRDGDDADEVTVTLQAAFRPGIETEGRGGRDERDVYFLVMPYWPIDGEPLFPDLRLQALLRTPPPEWQRHPFSEDGELCAPGSTFASRLPGATGGGVEVALAELAMSERTAMVWLFTAVMAREQL